MCILKSKLFNLQLIYTFTFVTQMLAPADRQQNFKIRAQIAEQKLASIFEYIYLLSACDLYGTGLTCFSPGSKYLCASYFLCLHLTLFVSPKPPYAEIVDECTKYICVNNQLVLFNKSQSCPFISDPPNCGLLGFAVLVNGDKCCPKWDCPCKGKEKILI